MLHILAAFMVLSGHMCSLMGRAAPVVFFNVLHGFGIEVIFVISGYLVTLSWENDRNYLRYLARRFFRIIPPLAVCVVFTAFIIGPAFTRLSLAEYFGHEQFRNYFWNIALNVRYFLPAVFEKNIVPNAVNGSLWSLPVQACMYLLTPAICKAGKKLNGKVHLVITASTCAASIISAVYLPEWHFVIYGMDLSHALYVVQFYLLGSLAAVWRIRKEFWSVRTAIVMLFALQIFQETGVIDMPGFREVKAVCYVSRYLVITYAVFTFAFGTRPVKSGILLKLQALSYGVYLYGFPIQQAVVCLCMARGLAFTVPGILALSSAAVLGMAYLSHVLIEEPSRRLCGKAFSCLNERQAARRDG